jgi:hypothetical protein
MTRSRNDPEKHFPAAVAGLKRAAQTGGLMAENPG